MLDDQFNRSLDELYLIHNQISIILNSQSNKYTYYISLSTEQIKWCLNQYLKFLFVNIFLIYSIQGFSNTIPEL